MKNNIILVGFMATGKTTLGKLLANKLNFDFIDTDQLIEKTEGTSISNIFALKGEAYFRKKESKLLDLLASSENTVISTGGGMVISAHNRSKLKDIGRVVYLKSNPEWILTNLNRSRTIRPLLVNEKDPIKKIRELLDKRKEYYEEIAEFVVIVGENSPNEIVNNIICKITSTH